MTIVHRSAAFKAMEVNLEAVDRLGIARRLDTRVTGLEVEDGALRAVALQVRDGRAPSGCPATTWS